MVNCASFLQDYSDFRDGLVSGRRREALALHLASCASCARYDRVVAEGVTVYAGLPEIEPSHDFMPRLQHRIYHLEDDVEGRGRASGVPLAFTVAIAAAIAMSAWVPLMRPRPATLQLPPVVAHAPHRVEAVEMLFRSGPFLTAPETGLRARPISSQPIFFPYDLRGAQPATYRLLPVLSR